MKSFKEIRDGYDYVGLVELKKQGIFDYGYVIYYAQRPNAVLHWVTEFATYEQAEEACLKELNKIVETLDGEKKSFSLTEYLQVIDNAYAIGKSVCSKEEKDAFIEKLKSSATHFLTNKLPMCETKSMMKNK